MLLQISDATGEVITTLAQTEINTLVVLFMVTVIIAGAMVALAFLRTLGPYAKAMVEQAKNTSELLHDFRDVISTNTIAANALSSRVDRMNQNVDERYHDVERIFKGLGVEIEGMPKKVSSALQSDIAAIPDTVANRVKVVLDRHQHAYTDELARVAKRLANENAQAKREIMQVVADWRAASETNRDIEQLQAWAEGVKAGETKAKTGELPVVDRIRKATEEKAKLRDNEDKVA